MKKLYDILEGIEIVSQSGSFAAQISELVFDSRKAMEGTAFFAIKGSAVDGHNFIPAVIESGCKVVFADHAVEVPADVTLIVTENTSKSLALAATNFYDHPSKNLKLVGVTGTNGKTTTTTLLFNLYTKLGFHCGLLSTVVNKIGDQAIASTHTTPDPVSLNALLAQMVEDGCSHCFMEVSSHAVHQHRVTGLDFAGGVFTNITHDHLDYHKTFAEYINVKKAFFDHLSADAFALTNVDDKNGLVMLQNTKAEKHTYALKSPADFKVKVIENQFSGLVLNMNGIELWTRLIGDFNAYNLLAVFAVSQLLGEDTTEVMTVLSNLESVEGRFEYFQSTSGITAIVDYAHTPDALENVLKTVANIRTKNETVYTVVGCGGDRDKAKRPKMAAIACEMSDKVILTSDNPRSEDPAVILDEMMAGVEGQHFKKTLSILDREQAIKTAVSMAEKGDIILIAGKGHEKYQEIKGVKHDFDDMQITIDLFKKLEK
ncbi:MAG: UDP-N-acetylmuramoyl-L-alanyl-D-glutamate--2,6-diaminopimelate ligase [Crocinitomicaceae bacterium]|nr:MAG: UDP-N-acetylmuramoyl-L-alanyl-D-glutamate--2,6-diaminopimelate ligase [Crocinitomicaceae bacterium]